MRPLLTLALGILLAASAAPTALASQSALRMDLPEGATLGPDTVVPVNVTLTIQDFMCSEPRTFNVALVANATDGVKATFARTLLVFTTDAHAYFAETYTQTQTVDLTVRALNAGQVELVATFPEHERGPCLAPDGFQASVTSVLLPVAGPASDPAPEPAPEPAPVANETPADNETPSTNGTSPTPPTRPRPTTNGPSACSPDGGCGYISDYDAPAESAEEDNKVPAAGIVAAIAVIAVAAIARRRKK